MNSKPFKKFIDWYKSCEFPDETYLGLRKTVFIPDLVLSKVAKHSLFGYRLWDKWMRATKIFYPKQQSILKTESPECFDVDDNILNQLKNDGVAVIFDAFPERWIEEVRQYVLDFYYQAQEKLKHHKGSEPIIWTDITGNRMEYDPKQSRLRCYFPNEPHKISKNPQFIQDFMNLPVTHQIVERYYGMNVTPSRPYTMAEVMTPGTDVQEWHIDCLREGSKAFLYLSDVTEKQGPLRYLLGSNNPSRFQHEQIFRVGRTGLEESYFQEAENKKFDQQGKSLPAPANTLILFDNRGIHAGSLCTEGKRIVLVNGFRPASSTRVNPRFLPNLPSKHKQ